MLDNETKRRIDTARDILVGKVPTPQQQVEQITIALIYKFMDDMDKESVGFGGVPSYFTGELEKYSWRNLFASNVGGKQRYDLYEEGIKKLALHPDKKFPNFFRKIFEGAKVPYSDIETLSLFLKTISEFTYDHSEKLGDAFEYLLSIMGSQGDAGQFRTPRHIIDFIVEVMQPKKNESILDPACGTAGFLISAFKHIVKQNSVVKEIKEKDNQGNHVIKQMIIQTLTPDNRKKMMQNFVGYDISPDMVRLSLVNLYLHGFTTPNIFEYDTLTSEDRWNEYYDVIIANPPFMTPKGGIKPHKKFTVQANRSEVLFVDYIAEHIHPSAGRAGIIVPEGIIFQSATAYKTLRKMLVEKNYLYAVVSLPAGVFNPYSGVKTSILLMDKTLAKKTDNILFVKIENDGFDLGAQRREIDKNDLPEAINILRQYKDVLEAIPSGAHDDSNKIGGDNLTLKGLNDDSNKIGGDNLTPKVLNDDSNKIGGDNLTLKGLNDDSNKIGGDNLTLKGLNVYSKINGNNNATPSGSNLSSSISSTNMKSLRDSQILLVPKKKIREKDDYNLSIDRYRENSNAKQSEFEMVRLGEIVDLVRGITFGKKDQLDYESEDSIRVATTKAAQENGIVEDDLYFIPKKFAKDDEKYLREGDILISTANSLNLLGRTTFVSKLHYQCSFGAFMSLIRAKNENVLPTFLFHCLRTPQAKKYFEINANTTTNISNLSLNALNDFQIPLPPLSIQQQIVSKIEGWQKIIDGAKQVVENYKPQIDIDESWEMVRLGDVCDGFQYGSSQKSNDVGTIPCLRMGNIQNGEIDWSDLKYAPEDEDFEKYLLEENDVLFNRTNSPIHVGKTGIFRGQKKAVFAGYLIRILYQKDKLLGKFLNFSLNTNEAKEFFMRVKTDGINQSNINAKALATFTFPLPPISIQQEIVNRIEEEQALINANKKLITIFEQKIKDEINRLWKQKVSDTVIEAD